MTEDNSARMGKESMRTAAEKKGVWEQQHEERSMRTTVWGKVRGQQYEERKYENNSMRKKEYENNSMRKEV